MKSKETYLDECALNYGEDNFRVLLVNGDTDAITGCALEAMELYAGQSRWISVYKSLPTADGKYLVIDQDDYISIEIFETKENEFDCAGYIIAWRPLPTPPTP